MNIAFVGCGYVADLYTKTLRNYSELRLVGAYDQNEANLERFVSQVRVRKYSSLNELVSDHSLDAVLNLTNPRSHYDITKQCLEAGKHVYSEKPLAMTTASAIELSTLADTKSLLLSSAPCSLLSETAQTMWKAIRQGVIGRVRLVYANFDEGMIAPNLSPWTWTNDSGVSWPAKDEFEVGCTYEHAGYVLTWLAAFFGPALNVTSFASNQIPDKGIPVDTMAPDFTVGCIEYTEGVVARLTCSIVAPKDKSLTVIGDDGVLFVGNLRNDAARVILRTSRLRPLQTGILRRTQWLDRWLESRIPWPGGEVLFQRKLPLVRKPQSGVVGPKKPVDFMRGPAEMVDAIREKRPCRLSAQLGTHIVEIIEALQHPERFGGRKKITTSFAPIKPQPWAD